VTVFDLLDMRDPIRDWILGPSIANDDLLGGGSGCPGDGALIPATFANVDRLVFRSGTYQCINCHGAASATSLVGYNNVRSYSPRLVIIFISNDSRVVMPRPPLPRLTPEHINLVERWIAAGAPNN